MRSYSRDTLISLSIIALVAGTVGYYGAEIVANFGTIAVSNYLLLILIVTGVLAPFLFDGWIKRLKKQDNRLWTFKRLSQFNTKIAQFIG